jgi:hypothetical protein
VLQRFEERRKRRAARKAQAGLAEPADAATH